METVATWGDVLSVRYDKFFQTAENQPRKVEGAAQGPVIVRGVVNLEGLQAHYELRSDKRKSSR